MSLIGKSIRLERIMDRDTKKMVIVPMDHGLTVGPIKGLEDMGKMVNMVAEGGANAVLGHIGLPLFGHRGYGKDIGLILHLSGSTSLSPNPNFKVLVNDVEEAIKIGADAVSIHINVGADDDPEMLKTLGNVSRSCRYWGIPLVAMMYPRGPNIKDENDVEVVKIAARVGAELGADVIKTNWTGDEDSFREVAQGCPVPVIIAGGSKINLQEVLDITQKSMNAGAAGVAFGRNIFQAEDPVALTRAICLIVHKNYTPEEAIKESKLKI